MRLQLEGVERLLRVFGLIQKIKKIIVKHRISDSLIKKVANNARKA